MRMGIVLVAVVAMLTGTAAAEVFTGEKVNGPFTVHGRLRNYNGSGLPRIWVIGSHRVLYVAEGSAAMERINAGFADGQGYFTREVVGDFRVLPLKKDVKGHMRPVKVLGVKHGVMRKIRD